MIIIWVFFVTKRLDWTFGLVPVIRFHCSEQWWVCSTYSSVRGRKNWKRDLSQKWKKKKMLFCQKSIPAKLFFQGQCRWRKRKRKGILSKRAEFESRVALSLFLVQTMPLTVCSFWTLGFLFIKEGVETIETSSNSNIICISSCCQN